MKKNKPITQFQIQSLTGYIASTLANVFGKNRVKYFMVVGFLIIASAWTFRLVVTHERGFDYERFSSPADLYSSDDAAIATIMFNWQSGHRDRAVTGDDNWFFKWPIFIFSNNLKIEPLQRLFLNSFITLNITAAIFTVFMYLFAKFTVKTRRLQNFMIIAGSLSLAAIPSQAFRILKWPSSRNIELPLMLTVLLCLMVYEISDSRYKKWHSKLFVAALTIGTLVMAEDPLFVYAVAGPLMLVLGFKYFFGVFRIQDKFITLNVALSVFLSTLLRQMITIVFPLGLYKHESDIATFPKVLDNLRYLLSDGLKLIGADLYGRPLKSVGIILVCINLGLIFFSIMGFWAYYKNSNRELMAPKLLIVLAVWSPLLLVISTLTDSASDSIAARYMIIMPFMLFVGLLLAVKYFVKARQRILMTMLLLLCVITVGAYSLNTYLTKPSVSNSDNRLVVDAVKYKGLTKGYAKFGDSAINSYISDQKTQFIPVTCIAHENDKQLKFFDLLTERAVLGAGPTHKSFYMTRGDQPDECDASELIAQLGKPVDEFVVAQEHGPIARVMVYDYDIGSRLPTFEP